MKSFCDQIQSLSKWKPVLHKFLVQFSIFPCWSASDATAKAQGNMWIPISDAEVQG